MGGLPGMDANEYATSNLIPSASPVVATAATVTDLAPSGAIEGEPAPREGEPA